MDELKFTFELDKVLFKTVREQLQRHLAQKLHEAHEEVDKQFDGLIDTLSKQIVEAVKLKAVKKLKKVKKRR